MASNRFLDASPFTYFPGNYPPAIVLDGQDLILSTAENWDWEIGYKRPGFVHPHHRSPHYVGEIDRERVRLYREAELEADRRAEHREERRDEHAFDDDRGFHCVEPIRGVGAEWIGQEGAPKAARKDWMERAV